MFEIILILLVVALLIILGRKRQPADDTAIRQLRLAIDDLERRLRTVESAISPGAEALEVPPAIAAAATQPAVSATESPWGAVAAEAAPAPAPAEAAPGSPPSRSNAWDRYLADNWLVLLGGVAVAVGAAFMVKVTIEYGLLGPGVRMALTALLGVALCVGSEWIDIRDPRAAAWHVPEALAASGCAALFAAVYGSYALYGFFGPLVAFAMLAAVCALAVALSWRHGPFVAALGILGGYAVPILVDTGQPDTIGLFSYLTIITAGALAVLRLREWPWLAWLALAGSALWVVLWIAAIEDTMAGAVALFLVVQMALFVAFRHGVPGVRLFAGVLDHPTVLLLLRTALPLLAVLLLLIVMVGQQSGMVLGCAWIAAAGLVVLARCDQAADRILLATASILAVLVIATWDLTVAKPAFDPVLAPVLPEAAVRYLTAAFLFALPGGGGGFLLGRRAASPGLWAATSVIVPEALLTICRLRLGPIYPDLGWSSGALILAALSLAAAERMAAWRRAGEPLDGALAAYAVGVLGGTILAVAFTLEDSWLTMAIALHIPAIAWVERRLPLRQLREVAFAIATSVLVRLFANPDLLLYPLAPTPVFNWLILGYGVPALAFGWSASQFRRRADDAIVALLEAGAVALVAGLALLESRHLLEGGRIDGWPVDLGREAVGPLVWLVMGSGLLQARIAAARPVLRQAGLVLVAIAAAWLAIWGGLLANPLLWHRPVGTLPILDDVLLAYGLPALLLGRIAWIRQGPRPLWLAARGLALAFALAWVSLEVRHLFHGAYLDQGDITDAEGYSYSLAWLIMAVGCLLIGLLRPAEWARRAGLAAVGLVACKVFLLDVSTLSGVWRAVSFLGLGGALMGVGYLYRRLVPARSGP